MSLIAHDDTSNAHFMHFHVISLLKMQNSKVTKKKTFLPTDPGLALLHQKNFNSKSLPFLAMHHGYHMIVFLACLLEVLLSRYS